MEKNHIMRPDIEVTVLKIISLDGLYKHVPEALASMRNWTILANYHQCQCKIDFYHQSIKYGLSDWVE